MLRKRRRNLLCGGWCVSVAALAAAWLSCVDGTDGCLAYLGLAAVIIGLWHPLMKREGGVAVLIYHSITPQGEWLPWSDEISVPPELFRRQLQALRKMRCTILRTSELVEARMAGRPAGRRPVVIHFDDGYLDNWVAALPLLKEAGVPATVFVSTDFIESGNQLRPTLKDVESGVARAEQLKWDGYLNWAELRAMETSGLMDVECHGTNHCRVATGPAQEDVLTAKNWRRHAWMQWRHIEGNKSAWYKTNEPPFEPLGTPVPQSAAALAARSWSDGVLETQDAYESRVIEELRRAKRIVEQGLDKTVRFFCWPFNETIGRAHVLALQAGFVATTGGAGENRAGEDPAVISRFHVNASVLGQPSLFLDTLIFRANVRLLQGNYYWGLLILPVNMLRRVARAADVLLARARSHQ